MLFHPSVTYEETEAQRASGVLLPPASRLTPAPGPGWPSRSPGPQPPSQHVAAAPGVEPEPEGEATDPELPAPPLPGCMSLPARPSCLSPHRGQGLAAGRLPGPRHGGETVTPFHRWETEAPEEQEGSLIHAHICLPR